MKPEDNKKSPEEKPADPQWNQSRTITQPGSALEVKVVHMPDEIRIAIGNALNAGKAQRSFSKKLFGLLF